MIARAGDPKAHPERERERSTLFEHKAPIGRAKWTGPWREGEAGLYEKLGLKFELQLHVADLPSPKKHTCPRQWKPLCYRRIDYLGEAGL